MSPINRELLERYMQGECTPEEETVVHLWLDENDIDDYSGTDDEKRTGKQINRSWQRLAEQVNELKIVASSGKKFSMHRLKVAAVVTGIVLLASVAALYVRHIRSDISYQTTTYGEIKRINLVDGTIVTLNAQSTLEIRPDFNTKNRTVYLKGEAYFQVKHHADKPFVVKVGKLSVTALGTSFDVSAFANDPEIAVSLKEGKVLVKSTGRKKRNSLNVVLKPGERAVYKKTTADLRVNKFNAKSSLAWQRQDIYFENADIGEVLRKLERFYGVSFDTHLLQPRHWQLSGEYKNQTLRDVLNSLSFNYNLKYEIEGQKVILYEK